MNLKLLASLKTRDAAVIYEFLFERNNRAAGEMRDLSFDAIAAELTAAGLTTARGSKFTAQVVRNRFSELEGVDIIQRVETAPGYFNIYIFVYPGVKTEEPAETNDEEDEYKGRTLFENLEERDAITTGRAPRSLSAPSNSRFQIEIENEIENENGENENVHKEEYININKKINNQVSVTETFAANAADGNNDDRPNVADVRKRVDFENHKVAKFRAEVVRRCWEPSVNPDLIDRVVALAVLQVGESNARSVFAMITAAKDAVRRYENTDGRAGRSKIWETLAYSTKRIYETSGWKWTPTRIGNEPRPVDQSGLSAALAAALKEDDE